ncbi:hypothetical protein HNR19_003673 [Nocardioides thalensis]|uniref:Uncharacterized protein n=1 Tax=Nocardioides thalensis TaxID=1914755 RepID=A0A853C5B9_9ACTN|nr:permease prefix domain 1-containing protein [Nocardioides thalensis]NYJ02975.1 hypothetical protein [Nocardioides thalensis]
MSIATYVSDLDAALAGPRRARRDLVREAADHLDDAAEAYVDAGVTPAEAEERAVADFGTVAEVAPGFQATIALASARRTALLLLVALGIQPLLWDGGLEIAGHRHNPDSPAYRVLDAGVEVVGFLGIVGGLAALALTLVGQRWVTDSRRTARVAAWYGMVAAVSVKLTGVSLMLVAGAVTPTVIALTVVFLVVPLSLVGTSARRTLALC